MGMRCNHGTNVAGVIGMAKDNGKCGVGVAYHSTITGEKLSARARVLMCSCKRYTILLL